MVIVGLASVVGLQTARLFAARGVRVIGIAGSLRHFAARTRVCDRIIEADVHTMAFLDALEALGPQLPSRAVVVPCTDQAALITAKHRDRLAPWYDVSLSPYDVMHQLADKGRFAQLADELGMETPRTRVLRSAADAESAAADLRFPVVLKPTIKSAVWRQQTGVKVLTVFDAPEMLHAYERLHVWTPQLVAQEYIEGADSELSTCNCYFSTESQPLVTFTTRKQRQWPPHVGIASYALECRDDELVAATLRLFSSVTFVGLGYLEAKRDKESGRLQLIEANVGRPTGRSATAESGGVELLYTMYCDAAGLPLPRQREQTFVGAGWLDLRRDLLAALYYYRRGELTLRDWWCPWLRTRTAHAVFSWSDPLPFVYELKQSAQKAFARRWQLGAVANNDG